MSLELIYATVLTGVVEVLGVWVASMTIHSGAAATWALLRNRSGDEIARQAAYGLAVGFVLGMPLTIAAGITAVFGGG